MEKKKTYKDLNIPNNTIREMFVPTYVIKLNGKKYRLFRDSPWAINFGIEMDSTNRLGYKPIKEEGEKVKTPKDLKNYLGKMELRILENRDKVLSSGLFPIIPYINKLEIAHERKNEIIKRYDKAVCTLLERTEHYEEMIKEHNLFMKKIYGTLDLEKTSDKRSSVKDTQLKIKFPRRTLLGKLLKFW